MIYSIRAGVRAPALKCVTLAISCTALPFFPHSGRSKLSSKLIADWLARGTRPDIAHAVQRLSTRVSKWSGEEDKALYHLMQYLKGTLLRSIWYSVDPEEVARGTVVLHGRCDSDHAGQPTSARSTSGWRLELEGTRTFALLDWGSRRQGGTAKSTPEAELLAVGDLITRSLAPVGEAISEAFERHCASLYIV